MAAVAGVSNAGAPIRVAVVDDDALVRAALTMMLQGADDIEIVGEAPDGATALSVVAEQRPNVVLMDIRMPVMDGLEATAALLEGESPPKIIVLTTFDADEYVARALGGGASGFLLKDTPPAELIDAVHKVAAGEPILSPSVTATLIRQVTASRGELAQAATGARHPPSVMSDLTKRERDVAVAVAQGKPNADIAAELYMSVATVKAHVSRVLMKLGVTNRVQIAIRMHEAGLL